MATSSGVPDVIIKPTYKKPKTEMGKELEKDVKKQQAMQNTSIDEEVLNLSEEEKESLKKKIFDLAKMETLVHNDQKLSSVYENMSEDGEEKYGYHYNETIMNIIFNEYVLNSPRYLDKYKSSPPAKKKRRDKSGINQLQQKGEEEQDKKEKSDVKEEGFDIQRDGTQRIESMHDTMEEPIGSREPAKMDDEENVEENTGSESSGAYAAPVGYEQKKFVKEGEEEEEIVDETNTTSSAGDYAYVKPFGKRSKDHIANKPAWKGGEMIGNEDNEINESYLVNSKFFKEVYNNLNEGENEQVKDGDPCWDGYEMVGMKKKGGKEVPNCVPANEGMNSPNDMSRVPMAQEGELSEHHLHTREDKIKFIISNWASLVPQTGKGQYSDMDQMRMLQNKLENASDEEVDKIYRDLESEIFDIEMNEEQINEVAPPDMEDWIMKNKESFKNKYGKDNWQRALYATAWSIHNKKKKKAGTTAESVDLAEGKKKKKEEKDKSVSKKQQKFMGMVHAYKKGELKGSDVSKEVKDAAKSMKNVDAKAFASTKHKGLPEKVKDDKKKDKKKKVNEEYMNEQVPEQDNAYYELGKLFSGDENKETEEFIEIGKTFIDDNFPGKDPVEILTILQDKMGSIGEIDEESMIDHDEDTIAMSREDGESMKIKQQPSGSGDMGGIAPIGGIGENEEDDIDNLLEFYNKHMDNLKKKNRISEERKHNSMVNLERLKKDNAKNFKADLDNSNLDDAVEMQDEIMAKDQVEEIGDNPYELAQKIEKDKMKDHKFNSFDNVGDSTNDNNKEVPKRNQTDEESEMIAMDRGLGMHDIMYDLKPSDRFEERMKKDMGEEWYELRERKMNHRSNAQSYNKELTAVGDSQINKTQFDKNKKGYGQYINDFKTNESVSARYKDQNGVNKVVDFKLNEVKEVETVNEGWVVLNLEGMGNIYSNKVELNEGIAEYIKNMRFYMDDDGNIVVNKNKVNLNESEKKTDTNKINEQFEKMKHFIEYDPSKFTDTKSTKGFF